MNQTAARTTPRRTLTFSALGGVGLVLAFIIGGLVYRDAVSSPSSFQERLPGARRVVSRSAPVLAPPFGEDPAREPRAIGELEGTLTRDDGVLPEGVTAFDDEYAGVVRLDTELLQALREAARDAADDGVAFEVASGWRSRKYQTVLFREALAEYGSRREAMRWVATADTSPHVSGDAVDIGPAGAAAWLSDHGSGYGLCQIYRNEPWHFELRPGTADRGCPSMYADPARDPRMQH